MGVTNINSTNNQAHFGYDTGKVFIFDNRYEEGTLLNASGGAKTFLVGTVMGRVHASNKLVPCASGATDGSQYPVGVLATETAELVDTGEQTVRICVSGDVAQEKLILDGSDTLATVISAKTLGDRIKSDTLGVRLVAGTELTGLDNQ